MHFRTFFERVHYYYSGTLILGKKMAQSSAVCDFGWKAPQFNLPSTKGIDVSLKSASGNNGTLIMFICNHCPYVVGALDDIVQEAPALQKIGVNVLAICSNDAEEYPQDNFLEKVKLKRDADFIVVDMHGEITSEKMAMGHLFDGKATAVVGTHTHVPTSDHRVMEKGTAYQTDLGMCGDYNSVIGMNRDNSLKKFFKDPSAKQHFPALGEATISGLMVVADETTGLAKKVEPIIFGGSLQERM